MTPLLLIAALFSGSAQACEGDPIPGTPQYNLMFGAINTNAQVYGAAALLEDHLLPLTEVAPLYVVHYTVTATPGLMSLPVDCGGGQAGMQAVDLSSGAFGAGLVTGPVTWYLAGSSSAHTLAPREWNERAVSPFLGAAFIAASPVAFYQRQFVRDDFSLTFDAIVGLHADLEVAQLSAAYVGSKGLYTNVSSSRIGAFLGSVVRPDPEAEKLTLKSALPYARGGFSDLDWVYGEAVDTIGSTALFARNLQHQGVSSAPPGSDQALQTDSTSFSTLHLQQRKLGKFVDFNLAAATAPQVVLHEATVGLNIGQALPEATVVSRIASDGFSDEDIEGIRFEAGVVNMPEQWYFADEGGMRFRWNVDVNLGGYEGDSYRLFFMSIGMNNAETLAVFPYATNVGYLSISGSFL